MSEVVPEEARSPSPGTPPPSSSPRLEDGLRDPEDSQQSSRGKKRHRRAKGKKKKQKTSLMITNEDGTNSSTWPHVIGFKLPLVQLYTLARGSGVRKHKI